MDKATYHRLRRETAKALRDARRIAVLAVVRRTMERAERERREAVNQEAKCGIPAEIL